MKHILILFILLSFPLSAFAECYNAEKYEHLFCEKSAKTNLAQISDEQNIICKGNCLKIAFSCKFKSECMKAGDSIDFDLNDAVYTQEGTLLIPACSKITGTIIRIDKQRIPNKNARVYINFNCLRFPDGTSVKMYGIPSENCGALLESGWMTAGKLSLYTIGLGCVGAGAGVGFAFIATPLKIGVGLAIGIPVGCTVGLITGLITPGLKYHAKQGEIIEIVLCDNLVLPKICKE